MKSGWLTRLRVAFLVTALYLACGTLPSASAAPKTVTSVRIFLVDVNGKGLGCGGGLAGVTRHIQRTSAPLTAALRLLLTNRNVCGEPGLCSALARARLWMRRVTVLHGKAVIHLAGKLYLGGICDNPRVRGQFRATALQFASVRTVSIFINNVALSKVLSQH